MDRGGNQIFRLVVGYALDWSDLALQRPTGEEQLWLQTIYIPSSLYRRMCSEQGSRYV